MRPAAAPVSSLAAAAGRAGIADRIENCDVLLGEAKEDVVSVAEVMIDPHLPAIRIVGGGPALRKVVLRVAAEVRRRRIGLEELLHRGVD